MNKKIILLSTFVLASIIYIGSCKANPLKIESNQTPSVTAPLPVSTPVITPVITQPITDSSPDFISWIMQVLPALKSTLPGGKDSWVPVAIYGVSLLLKSRSQGHLLDTATKLNPLSGGNVDITGAASSFMKAVGLDHSSEASAEAAKKV